MNTTETTNATAACLHRAAQVRFPGKDIEKIVTWSLQYIADRLNLDPNIEEEDSPPSAAAWSNPSAATALALDAYRDCLKMYASGCMTRGENWERFFRGNED